MAHLSTKKSDEPTDLISKNDLSTEQIRTIISASLVKGIAGALIPGLRSVIGAVEAINQEIRAEKLNNVLRDFQNHFDSTDRALTQLKTLLSSRAGVVIFHKVVQIVDNGSSDGEWLGLLSKVLKKVSDSDFEKHFEKRAYVLSQIARLSPQALIILSNYPIWRDANIQGTTTTSGQTAGDWQPQVTSFLKAKLEVKDSEIVGRMNHSFEELHSTGMIKLEGHKMVLTPIGGEIQELLNA